MHTGRRRSMEGMPPGAIEIFPTVSFSHAISFPTNNALDSLLPF